MSLAPSSSTSTSSAPMLEQLLLYLSALPNSRDIETLLRLTLQSALSMIGASNGAAIAVGEMQARVEIGPDTEELWPALLNAWLQPALGPDALPAIDPPIWRSEVAGEQLLYCALNADGHSQGMMLIRLSNSGIRAGADEALIVITRAAGNMLALLRGLIRTQHRLAELQLINEVTAVTGSTLELSVLLELVVRLTQTALRSEACTLMLIDQNTNELVFEVPTGKAGGALKQMRMPANQGIAGWVATRGEPAIVNDARNDERFNTGVDQESGFTTRNVMAVPLQARSQVIGVLEVLNKFGSRLYTEHDLALLVTLAGQVAVALDNARLYTSLQQQYEKLLATEETVRKELARDLHDGPAQQIAAIVMEMDVLRKMLQHDPTRLPQELDALEAIARKANRQVRTLQFQLRPIVLEAKGLRAALEYYVGQVQETSTVKIEFDAEGCTARLPALIERGAFDILQEALGNVRRHSGATHAEVIMREEQNHWRLVVRDDGKGFDVPAVLRSYETRGSLGMINMRERAQALGGELNIDSAPGQGTTITILIPSDQARD